MEFHDIANIFPLLEGEEFEKLVDDVKRHGLNEPIWTYEEKILDGRNRYRACEESGVEARYREYEGDNPIQFSVSQNLMRRHLNHDQRAMLALPIKRELEKEAKKHLGGDRRSEDFNLFDSKQIENPIDSSKQSASMVGVGRNAVVEADKLQKNHPELAKQVTVGKLTIPQANREVRQAKREVRREENKQIVTQAPTIQTALTTAKFATIVIDPPWDVSDEGDNNQFGRANPAYATMTIDQLLDVPVDNYADTDCHLYLWTTNRSLPKGFTLLEKWGFRYITCITWVKPSFGIGNYFRGQTEQILFGVKGQQLLKRKDASTYFVAPRGPDGHSSKPVEFYELVESCSYGPYLELFARSQRTDWISWGAEV